MPNSGSLPSSEAADSTSRSLIERVKAWEPAAWEWLISLYGPLVHDWIAKARLQSNDAADVAQEVFRAVAGSIESFRHDRPGDRFRAWLRTITQNKIRDHFRAEARRLPAVGGSGAHQRLLLQAESLTLAEDSDEDERLQIFGRAAALMQTDFEEATWKAFWGTVIEQRDTAEVAAELGMTPGAVLKAKSRVRRRLRTEFAELLD